MNLGKKIVSVAAGVALVAGAGLATASPAVAKKATIKGDTNILVPTAIIQAAGAAGIVISPIDPAKALATMEVVDVQFPVANFVGDGIIRHRGGLSLASDASGVTLTFTNPSIQWGSGPGIEAGAQIFGTIGGVPDAAGGAQLNGNRAPLFDIKNAKVTSKKGKVAKDGKKGYKRTDRVRIVGDVSLVDNATVIGLVNQILATDIFVAGMPFGAADVETQVTIYCKTKKLCR
ncbi:MAG: hypothetical protein RL347_435 [Actinomycetota bacterium]|jgi:hypothetical protein